MRYIVILFGLLLHTISFPAGMDKNTKPQKAESSLNQNHEGLKLAFQNNEFISFHDFATGQTKNLVEGFDPCISPDGKWVAYTESSDNGNRFSRIIRLINTEDSTIKDLDIDDSNHYGAIWSPSGDYLAFNIMKPHWQIGLIKADGSGFRTISTDSEAELYGPSWSKDGQYIFAHDLSYISI